MLVGLKGLREREKVCVCVRLICITAPQTPNGIYRQTHTPQQPLAPSKKTFKK